MEVLGGLAIFVGFFVSITALPLICTMLVAMFTIQSITALVPLKR
ncbi:DoxX family membrane protein [Mucilaginibacter calamicampi]|uniref:DoxX family membrane protein n=1 Tax=Mucilaginibacter calamicampi TaxID=1302352 RepID=A0ABW2YT67_9SPHI